MVLPDGERARAAGLFQVQGAALKKISHAEPGEVVAIGKLDHARAGQLLSTTGKTLTHPFETAARPPVYALAIAATSRNDDVRLSSALAKLIDEDPALSLTQTGETHQTLLGGQSEAHLRLALDRLKRRFGLDVSTAAPTTPYRETITAPVT